MKGLLFLLTISGLFLGCSSGDSPKILVAIGDSNGASEHGWVVQLTELRKDDSILNFSVPGNTIGFDNLGQHRLNTLRNIETYLDSAYSAHQKVDMFIVLLGTNDCKAVFDDRQDEVVTNLDSLITSIRDLATSRYSDHPGILIVSPPPYGPDSVLIEKYKGGDERVRALLPEYEILAKQTDSHFADVYEPLKNDFMSYSSDGVHLSADGQMIIAQAIDQKLREILRN